LAIEHHLPIVPLVFPDNKKRYSYTFFSGSPGKMRVKILRFIETADKTLDNRKAIKTQSRNLIYNELIAFEL
jgi:1-acyl-sn-glycerol-3-phosphate acyltransferase